MHHSMFTLQANYLPANQNCPLYARELFGLVHPSQVDHQRATPHLDPISLPPDFVDPEHPLNHYQTPTNRHVHYDWTLSIAFTRSQQARNTQLEV
jgi:hypothetical protein